MKRSQEHFSTMHTLTDRCNKSCPAPASGWLLCANVGHHENHVCNFVPVKMYILKDIIIFRNPGLIIFGKV